MTDAARQAYETLAPGYDALTAQSNYELWLGDVLLPELRRHGLSQGRVLDAGCGTGSAFEPLLRRGWEVVGCDVSPRMLAQAERKFGADVPLSTVDLRKLPLLGRFELVLALNDVVNYLTEDGDLERALVGMRANLAPRGLLLFDSNSLAAFRSLYTDGAHPGGTFEAVVSEIGIEPHVHRQRHFTESELEVALTDAGLELLAMLGQEETATRIELRDPVDQERDRKIVCIARSRRR
ncbi:MAG: class I SAM-dependent methyltransferase [Solirubrobacterales bacterium]